MNCPHCKKEIDLEYSIHPGCLRMWGVLMDFCENIPEHRESVLWYMFNNYRLDFEGFLRNPQLIKRRNNPIENYLSELNEEQREE